jgi:hypothetical protein
MIATEKVLKNGRTIPDKADIASHRKTTTGNQSAARQQEPPKVSNNRLEKESLYLMLGRNS